MTGRILYDNVFLDGTLSTTNEVAGFEGENAIDWVLHDAWKPGVVGTQEIEVNIGTNTPADCFAIVGHNLGSEGCGVELSWYNGSIWTKVVDIAAAYSDVALLRAFTSASGSRWKVTITNCTVDAYISQIVAGAAYSVAFAPPLSPPGLMDIKVPKTVMSRGGRFVGRQVKSKPFPVKLKFSTRTPTEVRSGAVPFLTHANALPFFVAWDTDLFPDEVAYCWNEKELKLPQYRNTMFMDWAFNGVGQR